MYEFWLSKWEILTLDTQWFYTSLGPFIVLLLVVVYVISRIYGIKFGIWSLRRLMLLVGILLFAYFVFIVNALIAPEKMGFAVRDGKLIVDVGWWGVPSGKVYDISQCRLEWVNGTAVSIWRVGRGGPVVVVGKITLMPVGVSGYGMVVKDAEWILVARCPDTTYILGAPGLSPEVVDD